MTPLLLAAAVAFAGPVHAPLDVPAPSPVLKALPGAPSGGFVKPDLLKDLKAPPKDCSAFARQTLGPGDEGLKKLGDLPPGLLEHAVLRIVNGCPVREIVFAGQVYYLGVPPGGLQRLDPTAHRIVQR